MAQLHHTLCAESAASPPKRKIIRANLSQEQSAEGSGV